MVEMWVVLLCCLEICTEMLRGGGGKGWEIVGLIHLFLIVLNRVWEFLSLLSTELRLKRNIKIANQLSYLVRVSLYFIIIIIGTRQHPHP